MFYASNARAKGQLAFMRIVLAGSIQPDDKERKIGAAIFSQRKIRVIESFQQVSKEFAVEMVRAWACVCVCVRVSLCMYVHICV